MQNTQRLNETVPDSLAAILRETPKLAVAFSGGVDSSYLLYAATSLGLTVRAYYVNAQFQPAFELEDAKRLAAELGADIQILELDALSDPRVVENPANRCYYCKQNIFGNILARAAADGYTVVADGSNASDDAGDRPGMKALQELKVVSPLRRAGLVKVDVREYSRLAGLFTWDKPAYACLATRVPTGTPLDADKLSRVENAETALFGMGFTDFRVRWLGDAAKLQLPAAQMPQAVAQAAEIRGALQPWFADVLLDLQPR